MSEKPEINCKGLTFNPNQGTFGWQFIHKVLDCRGSRVSSAVQATLNVGFLVPWALESRKISSANRTAAGTESTINYRKYRGLLCEVAQLRARVLPRELTGCH